MVLSAQKTVEVSKLQFINMPVVVQQQVPMVVTVQNSVETPQLQVLGKVVHMPVAQKLVEMPLFQVLDTVGDMAVVVQRQVPTVQSVQKTVEISELQFIGKVVAILVVTQVAIAEFKIGASLPAKSATPIFVSAACQLIGFQLICH